MGLASLWPTFVASGVTDGAALAALGPHADATLALQSTYHGNRSRAKQARDKRQAGVREARGGRERR